MRRHLIISILVCMGLLALSAPAGAGLSDKEQEFCTALTETSATPVDDPGGLDPSSAENSAEQFRELAKVAPTKRMKKDLKIMAAFFSSVADIDKDDDSAIAAVLTSRGFRRYAVAAGRVSQYLLTTCLQADVPTT